MNRSILRHTLKTSLVFLSWVPVLYSINEHVVQVTQVKGSSMSPTLNPSQRHNDFVLLNKWNLHDSVQVGDVVVMRSPLVPEKIYVKRVKGVQGDTVVTRHPHPKKEVVIPRNHVWVEGDNIHSVDSNSFGPVSIGLLLGRVRKIVWPLDRIGDVALQGGRECRKGFLKVGNADM